LRNGFIDWCRSRYGANSWFVDHYYTPEEWASLLDNLPRVHSAPDGEILVARLSGKGTVMSGWRPFGNVIVDDVLA
jgi:hypothetical protein